MFNSSAPLGLPEGSVRALMALGILGVALAKWYTDGTLPDQLLALVGVVTTFYFGSRLVATAISGEGDNQCPSTSSSADPAEDESTVASQ